jgi:hypothetical protein
MPQKRARWRLVYLSYPCPVCIAAPGEDCITATGKLKREVHADRARQGNRCPRCGALTSSDNEPGQLCDRCELVRALEVERASYHRRRNP